MAAPIPDNASILELGCASGGNLIPIAEQLPNARIVGVDFSAKQIAEGRRTAEALQLNNLQLLCLDLQELDSPFGQFDYIVCHGVFSWVPDEVRNRILRICFERLTEFGVAYVSYNTYPGWFSRGLIRQSMLPYVSQEPNANVRMQQARNILSFLSQSMEGHTSPYANQLRHEIDLLGKSPDAYLFHEHLEEHNRPLFFYQFMEMATKHSLQFLGESILPSMLISNLPIAASGTLSRITGDLCEQNHYMDFATNRMFRQTLLCHKHLKLNRHLSHVCLDGGFFAGNFQLDNPQSWNNLDPRKEVIFQCASGRPIATKDPAVKALIFSMMDSWPGSLTETDLHTRTLARLSENQSTDQHSPATIRGLIENSLIHLILRGDIAIRYLPDRFTISISEKPKISNLARVQAEQGGMVATQRHTMWNPDMLTRLLLPLLDGETTVDDIGNRIAQLASENVAFGNRNISLDNVQRATLHKMLEQLRRAAMLVG